MNDVSATALTTLKCHEKDARSKHPILGDLSAREVLEHIRANYNVLGNDISPSKQLVVHIALRAKHYDDVARDFIHKHPNAIVVNIGCGLDNRFERVDNGRVQFYDLDLPDIIDIKRTFFRETDRFHYVSGSVFDTRWLEAMDSDTPILLLAEGVFMYCKESDVKTLFDQLAKKFSYFEFLFEVFNAKWLSGWRRKTVEQKLKKQLSFGSDAMFQFGLLDSNALEAWNTNLKLIQDWSYLDTNHPSLGAIRYFRKFELFRKMQWSVQYSFAK